MGRPIAQWSLAVICLLLGLALVTQFRTYHVVVKAGLSPADQAAFNVDMEEWLSTLDDKQREVARELAEGWDNTEIGARRGKSRGWTNLVRRDLRASWDEFTGKRSR